jgi:ABC-type multidrug transport system fused ATPase/permease subunit
MEVILKTPMLRTVVYKSPSTPVNIEFQNLSLFLEDGGKKVLDNVTGVFVSGRMAGIMGPSGIVIVQQACKE